MALDTDGHQWKQLAIATSFRSARPKVGSRCQVGTYHLQTTVQVRPARPQTSTAPSTREEAACRTCMSRASQQRVCVYGAVTFEK